MEWEMIIGLETHVELSTRTKAFCSCSVSLGGLPNSRCCPVCAGLPGALPRLNGQMVDYTARLALALGCQISPVIAFDRKNYFYPDLPKGYQISQFHTPLGREGTLPIRTEKGEKQIRIAELHMEEDAGKLIHDRETGLTQIDLNRCGVPLVEIVTQPDFRSAQEVLDYLERLRLICLYLGISDCKMQEGSLRCDVNLSLRPKGSSQLGTRTEMKNLGSFRAVARAIYAEALRQQQILESGGHIRQETRRWDEDQDRSEPMRPKETAADYRYFPEPDLPPLRLDRKLLERWRWQQPELAHEKLERYQSRWGLSEEDAQLISKSRGLADYYERLVALGTDPREGANWIRTDLLRLLKERGEGTEKVPLPPAMLARVISMTKEGRINRGKASQVLEHCFATGEDPEDYCRRNGLEQVRDRELIAQTVRQVLTDHPAQTGQYRAGQEKVFAFLVGRCMRALGGKADPKLVNELLREMLNS